MDKAEHFYKISSLFLHLALVIATFYLAFNVITISNTINNTNIDVTDYQEESGMEQIGDTIISKWGYKFNKEIYSRDMSRITPDFDKQYDSVCSELLNNEETEAPTPYYGTCLNQSKQSKTFLFKDNKGECYVKIVGLCA